jgi:hypothetical protein
VEAFFPLGTLPRKTGPRRAACSAQYCYPAAYPDADSAQRGKWWISPKPLILFGAPEEIRTPDPQIRSLRLAKAFSSPCGPI